MILIRLLYSNAHTLCKHSVEAAQKCQQCLQALMHMYSIAHVVWKVWRGLNLFNLYTYKSLIILIDWLIDCLLEAMRKNPGYGIATLIYNNLLNLILITVMLLRIIG